MESLDRNSRIRWANPTIWPVYVNHEVVCQNRQCGYVYNYCIEMGINADKYENAVGVFYVDTWNNVTINCHPN